MKFLPTDWVEVFALQTPLLELVVRALLLYLCIIALLRVMPRRAIGELEATDLVLVLLIAQAASHAMGGFESVTDALVVIVVIMGVSHVLNALSFRFRAIAWLTVAPPLQVVRNGVLLRRNMRRELLTEDELMSSLRQQGIDALEDVSAAYVEGEGRITVIRCRPPQRSAR